jgi:hypothetical protein
MMRRVLAAPLVHFLALGAVLLGIERWWAPDRDDSARSAIVVRAADRARLREAWTAEHGAPPTAAVEAALVRDAIDEEVLYREALARGFDRQDATVRERLVRLGAFVGEDAGGDRAALEREARRLGLERSDLVVRRHLVEMMRLAAGWLGPEDMPSDGELAAYLAAHADDFAAPARIRLTHVYLAADGRGARLAADAHALLDELRRTGARPSDAPARGDPFIRGADVDGSRDELALAFGGGFADAVAAAPIGTWTGPVASSYGLHLVWIRAREPASVPPLATVRGRVLARWRQERSERRARDAMDAMRRRYVVDVEDG